MERPAKADPIRDLTRGQARIHSLIRALQVAIDAAALSGAFALAYLVRRQVPLATWSTRLLPFGTYLPLLGLHTVTLLLIFFFARLYHQRRAVSRIDLAYAVAASVSVGVVMTNGLTTLLSWVDYSKQLILYVWLFSVLCVLIGRELHRQIVVRARVVGVARDRVLIVGSGDIAQNIVQQIQYNPELGYRIVGAVNGEGLASVAGIPTVGELEDLPRLLDDFRVDEVIIALPEATRTDLAHIVALCQRGKVNIKIYPDLFAYMTGGMSVDELGGLPLISVRDVALRGWKLTLKRGLDIIGAVFGLIILSPFLLLLAALIRIESAGSVFFSQERAGLDGRPFPMIKFRSMRIDAEKDGPGWTTKGDDRVTRIGHWLRSTNLDELPNLVNVLLGHMSLVGPRPEQTFFVQKFREDIPRYMERHREKAGMTGWAQVNGLRGDTSIEERIKFDLWYVENWSLWLDIKILIRTVFQTLLHKNQNAY